MSFNQIVQEEQLKKSIRQSSTSLRSVSFQTLFTSKNTYDQRNRVNQTLKAVYLVEGLDSGRLT